MIFDRSACTVLAVCERCDWLQLELTVDDAHAAALEHLWRVHPDDALALDAVKHRIWRATRSPFRERHR